MTRRWFFAGFLLAPIVRAAGFHVTVYRDCHPDGITDGYQAWKPGQLHWTVIRRDGMYWDVAHQEWRPPETVGEMAR